MLRRGLTQAKMLRGTLGGQGELHAAPRCIPSAHVQPKYLMKIENAGRTEHFHKNNVLAVCHSAFTIPLVLPFYLFVALPSGHSCEDRSDGSAPLTLVRFTVQH